MYRLAILAGVAVLIGLDHYLKCYMTDLLKDRQPVSVLGAFLELQYAANKGVSWGLFPDQKWLVLGVTGAVLAVFSAVLLSGRFQNSRLVTFGGLLVLAGGGANLIDRIFNGYVVDYLYVKIINFPIFNFADCCVVCGAVMILVYFFFFTTEKSKEKADNADSLPELPTIPEDMTERDDHAAADVLPGAGASGTAD